MPPNSPPVRKSWLAAGLAAAGFSAWAAVDWYAALPVGALREAEFVGRDRCAACHQAELHAWTGSHHDRAMETADDSTVLGDFDDARFTRFGVETRMFRRDGKFMVNTEGPDGQHRDYQVKWTFGVEPLQQYMVELEDGRVQVLRVSWDTEQKEWFYVRPPDVQDERILPGDPLHWTGLAQNWNTMCAECHSTNLHKNFDSKTNAYHTEYSEIDVSCEACHGPASVHVHLAESSSLFWDRRYGYGLVNPLKGVENVREVETCAPCHSRRGQIHDDYHAGKPLFDYFDPLLLQEGLYHADGQILDEVYVYGSFVQSKMFHKDVRCTDCHQPHSLKLKYEGNQLCGQCHQPGKYDGAVHHRHAGAVAEAAGATLCVNCHMPSRTYMEVDDRRDHSFRIPRPDLSVELGTPNACNDCHTKPAKDAAWAAKWIRTWYGDKRPDDPHYARALAAERNLEPEVEELVELLITRKETPDIVRATAVAMLAGLPGDQPAEWIREALEHDSPLVRAAAARALPAPRPAAQDGAPSGQAALFRQRKEFVGLLADLLEDPVRAVRNAAATRLVGIAGELDGASFRRALDRAVAEYREGLQIHLDRASANRNLADLAAVRGDLPEAIRWMRNAIRQEDYLSGLRSELARLLEQHAGANFDEVADEVRDLREQEAALMLRDQQLLPEAPGPHYQRGMLLYLLGDFDEARQELLKACELGPNDYGNWLALALLCQKQERWDQAVAALERMEQLQPGSPDVRYIYEQIRQATEKE